MYDLKNTVHRCGSAMNGHLWTHVCERTLVDRQNRADGQQQTLDKTRIDVEQNEDKRWMEWGQMSDRMLTDVEQNNKKLEWNEIVVERNETIVKRNEIVVGWKKTIIEWNKTTMEWNLDETQMELG